MNKNTKFTNPMKVITGPNTRWSYANVWEPKSINGGAPKYSVSLIIPKSDTKTVAKIQAAIEAAYRVRARPSSRATASLSQPSAPSRPRCATAIPSARMTPPMPVLTSSTPTPPALPVSWMPTAIPS